MRSVFFLAFLLFFAGCDRSDDPVVNTNPEVSLYKLFADGVTFRTLATTNSASENIVDTVFVRESKDLIYTLRVQAQDQEKNIERYRVVNEDSSEVTLHSVSADRNNIELNVSYAFFIEPSGLYEKNLVFVFSGLGTIAFAVQVLDGSGGVGSKTVYLTLIEDKEPPDNGKVNPPDITVSGGENTLRAFDFNDASYSFGLKIFDADKNLKSYRFVSENPDKVAIRDSVGQSLAFGRDIFLPSGVDTVDAQFEVVVKEEGKHVIYVYALDSLGLQTEASLTIMAVREALPKPIALLSVERVALEEPYTCQNGLLFEFDASKSFGEYEKNAVYAYRFEWLDNDLVTLNPKIYVVKNQTNRVEMRLTVYTQEGMSSESVTLDF